ncbi:MAG TPA: hypothetical protein VGO67_00775 [Verrucomicrobiae bacterium]|jgi:hypothetical protein
MKTKTQPKSLASNTTDARTFKAVISATEESVFKPPFDYQRIIICHSNRPELAPALALCSGTIRIGPADPIPSARAPSVLVVENAGKCDAKRLQSLVFLVNQTRSVIVLVACAEAFRQLEDRHKEIWAQIRRRTHFTFEFKI